MADDALVICLLSATTFGRGEGTAGEVDVEVEHDELGLPFLGGKSMHGLLRDTWLSMAPVFPNLQHAARRVLGPSRDLAETSILRVGDAVVDDATRRWVEAAVRRPTAPLSSGEVLRSLTDVRWQTSVDRASGGPESGTLRATRVVLCGLQFAAPLTWLELPTHQDLQVLALSALGTRHAGLGRNRGRGHIQVTIDGNLGRTRALVEEVES